MNKSCKRCYWFILIMASIILFACAPKARRPESVLDSPEHHYSNGMKFLNNNKLDLAYKEFKMAQELDPKYSPAYVGFALASSLEKNFENAFAYLDKAESYAKNKAEKALVQVGFIRVYTHQQAKDWLEDAEDAFLVGIKAAPHSPALYYYMGRAHKLGYEFDKASNDFKKVLEFDTEYIVEANEEWKLVQMIQRAAPGSKIGKQIALIEKIDRADVAALFIQELKLDKLLKKEKTKKFDAGFKPPSENAFVTQTTVKASAATDTENHVLKADIDEVLRLDLRGLSPYPDHTFRPDAEITRASFAIMVEDIIIAITGEAKLSTKFIGSESPFPDLRNNHWAFNAIMNATSRGIMDAKDIVSGEFRPEDIVSGAEALLVIRQLKEKLKF